MIHALIPSALSALKFPSFVSHVLPAPTVQERCGAFANNAARFQWLIPTKLQETPFTRLSPPFFLSFFISLIVLLMVSSWTLRLKTRKRLSMQLSDFLPPSLTSITPSVSRHFSTRRAIQSSQTPPLLSIYDYCATTPGLPPPTCCLVHSCCDVKLAMLVQ